MLSSNRQRKLSERIKIISQYYDLDALLEDKTDNAAVAKYYRASDFFYNLIHSRGGGYMHMGLSDGDRFYKNDLMKQVQFIDGQMGGGVKKVLEIGAGKVGNSKYLAVRHPEVEFTALDLPDRNFLKAEVPANVSLVEGSFSDLSAFDEGEFDLVFGIETVSYSDNKERVISEVARVLSPGGKLILFDIYEPKPHSEMTDFEKRVSAITFATMRLPAKDQYIGDVKKYLARHQFSQIDTVDLTEKIMPNLTRLERYSEYYFHHRLFLKTLKKVLPYDATINGIAGWLMPLTFDGENIHQYNRIVATKK